MSIHNQRPRFLREILARLFLSSHNDRHAQKHAHASAPAGFSRKAVLSFWDSGCGHNEPKYFFDLDWRNGTNCLAVFSVNRTGRPRSVNTSFHRETVRELGASAVHDFVSILIHASRRVSRVHHQFRVLHDGVVVVARMIRGDQHAIISASLAGVSSTERMFEKS